MENVVKELGINIPSDNPLYWGVPNIGVTALSGLGEESDAPFINDDKTIQFVDNFSWILGNHSVKFGGELRRVLYDQIGGVVTRGRFNFDGRYTRQPLLPAAQRGGAPFADFLLGHMNNSESQVGAPIADFRSNYYALYIQDNWKVTPNLTRRLRSAVGIRPAVHRQGRQDRQHRLQVGQQLLPGVRADGRGRSI